MKESIRLVKVFSTGDLHRAMFAKSLLEGANIKCVVGGASGQDFEAFGLLSIFSTTVHSITIEVLDEDYEKAVEALMPLSGNYDIDEEQLAKLADEELSENGDESK